MVLCCYYSTLLDDLWLSLYKTNPPCKVTVGRSSMHYVYLPQDQSSQTTASHKPPHAATLLPNLLIGH